MKNKINEMREMFSRFLQVSECLSEKRISKIGEHEKRMCGCGFREEKRIAKE
jgi:hypothetical protein